MKDNIIKLSEHATPDWVQECVKTEPGKPTSNVANAILALRRDPAFAGLVSYNAMLCAVLLLPCRGGSRRRIYATAADRRGRSLDTGTATKASRASQQG